MKLPHPIVSTQWLADNLDVPGLRIFDASVYLTVNPDGPGYITESGLARWRKAHIPGANFLEMLTEFLDNSGPAPMMMHAPEHFAGLCARHGIGDDSTVVIYSGQTMMWSARMWWMLRTVGFTNAAILDGGWEKWQREGRATSADDKPYPPATSPRGPGRRCGSTRRTSCRPSMTRRCARSMPCSRTSTTARSIVTAARVTSRAATTSTTTAS